MCLLYIFTICCVLYVFTETQTVLYCVQPLKPLYIGSNYIIYVTHLACFYFPSLASSYTSSLYVYLYVSPPPPNVYFSPSVVVMTSTQLGERSRCCSGGGWGRTGGGWGRTVRFITVVVWLFIRLLFIFCSTFVSFNYFVRFSVHCSLFIVKYSILILDCIPGISIPLSIITKQANKHHTSYIFVLV